MSSSDDVADLSMPSDVSRLDCVVTSKVVLRSFDSVPRNVIVTRNDVVVCLWNTAINSNVGTQVR